MKFRKRYGLESVEVSTKVRAGRKSDTLPNQALSVHEVVRRFVKNLPVDIAKRDAVFVDQKEYDLEKMARADFDEQHDLAQEFAQKAQASADKLQAMRQANDDQRRSESESSVKAVSKPKPKKKTGIDDLDNTMPVDTEPDDQ